MAHQLADHHLADSLLLEHVAYVKDDDGDPHLAKMEKIGKLR
jgi:hypothetical protein